jgi:hypothetical protein|tara:strand:+ start:4020 stop:4205 length:186 start_codon:yes stop_codon:yes gene_type:complete
MKDAITISKQEYDTLKNKADLFDHIIEIEELSEEELSHVKKALKGPFITKSDFLKKHNYLS